MYDSGIVAYGTSHAVPNATLSDRSTYYWRVRQQDSKEQWSEYSTATKFVVSESLISVTPIFGHIVVDQGDVVKIDAQVKLANETVINDASVNIKIYDPDGDEIEDESMVYLPSSSGIYRYSYNVPEANGSYLYVVTAVSDSKTGYGAANFEVRTLNYDVSDIQSKVNTLSTNMDILIGAFISASSSVNDGAATTTSFITNLTNLTNNFYKNSVLTFTSGALSGQVRRISAYAGDTKAITVSPAFSFAPANGNNFSIVKQNVYVEEQAENIQGDVTTIKNDVDYIKGKVDEIYGLLETVDENLTSAQTVVNQLRASQQKFYRASITDASEIAVDSTYKVKLTLLDYESSPVDPPEAPTIKIYDATDAEVEDDVMIKDSTGVYEYSYPVDSDAGVGLWEAVITTTVGELPDQVLTDYFQVTGSPAQVLIRGISDKTVDTITADITITNEGSADDFDYQYEWCVVSNQNNACGEEGGEDVDYGSGAKRILKGASWETSFYPIVPEIGDYWFKLVVYWGTESSEASQTFTAVAESSNLPSGGGGESNSKV
ncbi:MAG: hypothetical protein NTW46_01575 [Candidatus Nealsonbacteria bacterium]|nr:hypothetical protein [Candidatus Nealsonbacteria bacterium]